MKLPVPSDWDGETWKCLELQWPDSIQYRGILLGLMSYLTRGRVWDEAEGSIINAQAVGWEIFNKNYPLVPCGGDQEPCPDCPECPESPIEDIFGGITLLEDDMGGQVVTDVQLVDGKIRVFFGPCCWHDLSVVTAIEDAGPELGEEPWNPDGLPGMQYSACGKAAGIVDAIAAVLEAAHYVISADIKFIFWPSAVENQANFNLSDKWVVSLLAAWLVWGVVLSPEEVFGIEDQEKARCLIAPLLTNDASGVTSEQYEAIKSVVTNRGWAYAGLITTAVNALGRAGFDRAAKLGARDLEADCSCNDQPQSFGSVFWRLPHVGIEVNNPGLASDYTLLSRTNDGLTLRHRWAARAGDWQGLSAKYLLYKEPGVTLTEVVFASVPVAGNGLPKFDWHADGCATLYTGDGLSGPLASGVTVQRQVSGGAVYAKYNATNIPDIHQFWAGGRHCPAQGALAELYVWDTHIVSINGVATGVYPAASW